MRISEDFSNQLSLYINGNLDLPTFRRWHVEQLLDRHKFSQEEQEFLAGIEAYHAQYIAGLPEDAFKKSLSSLLSVSSIYILAWPDNLIVLPSQSNQAAASGAYIRPRREGRRKRA